MRFLTLLFPTSGVLPLVTVHIDPGIFDCWILTDGNDSLAKVFRHRLVFRQCFPVNVLMFYYLF